MATLYQRILGDRFEALAPVLRRFHSQPNGGVAQGKLQVIRAPGRLKAILAAVMRLPRQQDAAVMRLEVSPTRDGERWTRFIGQSTLITKQTAWKSLLLEKNGPVCLGLEIDIVEGGMVFRTRRAWFIGIPLPRWLTPEAEATALPVDNGWALVVRLSLPLVGRILEYRGNVVPEET